LEPVVPIELLAPDGEPALVETADLAGSFATYQRLLAADGAAPASLEVLLGLEAAPAPSPASPPAPAEEPPVAIGELLYRGRAALARAAEIRGALRAALAGGATPAELRPLLDELLDLVDLALAGGT
ncbi:MAG TPA: hypothetical protein VNK43_11950, partial [Gemmatimonadales bacterium]|nr:hypothetical protein [Gemmatimonadales bacterium]